MRRNTAQRQTVHRAVALLDHPSAEAVYRQVKEMDPQIGLATVYRNINILAEEGQIQRLIVPGQAERYDADARDHYHYLCDTCGRIYDVKMPYRPELNEEFAPGVGQNIRTHTILFQGVCKECRQKEDEDGSDSTL
ncbi:MAG: Fur family transcriptional regulator [Eubacteriales bacterium]|nr:Fur family transcriptional regulator [Eubacteriales bacterium]